MNSHQPIYLDHQATTPVEDRVLAAMMPFLREEFGNPHSSDHILGWRAAQAVEQAAEEVATLIGAQREEITFTSGATEANNLAILGIARGPLAQRRKRILVSAIEHKCVLGAARSISRREGLAVDYIRVGATGEVDINHLESMMGDDVLLVSVMAVNNEVGSLQPLKDIGELCKRAGSIFHSDCAQAPYSIDLQALTDCADIITLSAHKMYGPKGIGAAYIRSDLQNAVEPLLYGGGQQRGLRSGTLPSALCVGMGYSAKLAATEGVAETKKIAAVRDFFLSRLTNIGHRVHLNGPPTTRRHAGNANVRFESIEAQELLNMLQPRLAASTGAACSSGIPEPSHVLRAMGLSADAADCSVRFSIGRQTRQEDVEIATTLIEECIERIEALRA